MHDVSGVRDLPVLGLGPVTEPIVVTERITLETTSAEDQDEFISSVEASQSLLHPWIDAADTPARFAEMLSRAEGAEFHAFVVRERAGGRLASQREF